MPDPLDLDALRSFVTFRGHDGTGDDPAYSIVLLGHCLDAIEALRQALGTVEWNTPMQLAERCCWCHGVLPTHHVHCQRQAALALVKGSGDDG